MDISQFGKGGIVDRIDTRDYKWSEIGASVPPFDWNTGYDVEEELRKTLGNPTFKLPVKNQDGSGSCGGQAWATYGSVLEAFFTKTFEERSAKFIYAQTYVPQPGGGSFGRDNAEIVVKQGWAKESVLSSYDGGNPPSEAFMERSQDITDQVRSDAKLAKALSYANVNCDIDSIAQATKANGGMVIGILGSNNGTWGSAFPKPPKLGDTLWRHWIYAGKAKLINGKKAIGVLNSWGAGVGEQGWQWIDEDYFKNPGEATVWNGWTHIYNSNPVPPVYYHNFTIDLKLNDKGSEVVALQTALQIDGEFPSTVPCTGFYGDITRRAVLAFQLKYQIATPAELASINGTKVGPKTRAKLNQLFG